MGRTNANLFYTITKLEDIVKHETLSQFIQFITACSFSKNEIDKFICENYRVYNTRKLTELWNRTHPKEKKTESTIRGRVRNLSREIVGLLGFSNTDSIYQAIQGVDIKALERLENFLRAFNTAEKDDTYDYSLADYLSETTTEKTFDLAECDKELRVLKAFGKSNLLREFEKVDKEKLAYVFQLANQPLYQKGNINEVKLLLLSKFSDESEKIETQENPVIEESKDFKGNETEKIETKDKNKSEKIITFAGNNYKELTPTLLNFVAKADFIYSSDKYQLDPDKIKLWKEKIPEARTSKELKDLVASNQKEWGKTNLCIALSELLDK